MVTLAAASAPLVARSAGAVRVAGTAVTVNARRRVGESMSAAVGVHGVDMATTAGIYEVTPSWQGSAFDYDKDGCTDLIVNRHHVAPELYHNNCNGTFTLVRHAFSGGDHHYQAVGDFNGDGLPDLYWAMGGGSGYGHSSKQLWIRQPTHTFVNEAAKFHLVDPYGRGRGATALDVNNDGHVDLYVGNESPRMDGIPDPNRLWINTGNGSFRDASGMGLDSEEDVTKAQTVDVNHDGFQDIFTQGSRQSAILENQGGRRFANVSRAIAVADRCECGHQVGRPGWRRTARPGLADFRPLADLVAARRKIQRPGVQPEFEVAPCFGRRRFLRRHSERGMPCGRSITTTTA